MNDSPIEREIALLKELSAALRERNRLRAAIQRALDNAESGDGWGPDVTVCAYLREALNAD